MTGILLLAMGHKHYAEMACNLAMSLRCGAPDVDITLAWHGYNPQQLSAQKQNLFNNILKLDDAFVTKNGKQTYFRAKTLLNKITPYDNTLFLDVDVLWFTNPVTDLFLQFDKINFTAQNWGSQLLDKNTPSTLNIWADTHAIAEGYNLWGKQYVPIQSEVLWFKKNTVTDELFALANQIYDNPAVETYRFAGDVADEFGFNVACAVLGIYPHKSPYSLVWWHFKKADRKIPIDKFKEHGYAAFSAGGNNTPPQMVARYNAILQYAAQKAGIENYWKFVPKRRWAAERANA